MQVTDYVAEQTERVAQSFAHFVATSPPERLNWQPACEGHAPTRSMLDQAGECVTVNHVFAALLRGETPERPVSRDTAGMFADGNEAASQLLASGKVLADAIRGVDDAGLEARYTTPRGEVVGKNLIFMGLRNMVYHAGQINYIQTLYGDTEFHTPPNWR